MNTTVTMTAESRCYGNHKQYIARLVGRDPKYTFQREFIGRKSGRGDVTTATVDECGIYEICEINKKGGKESVYRIVVETIDGLVIMRAGGENLDNADPHAVIMGILRRMDAGESLASMLELQKDGDTWKYRVLSKAVAAHIDKARTIEEAVDSCWNILQSLPQPQAKKALVALRARVTPPAVTDTGTLEEQQ